MKEGVLNEIKKDLLAKKKQYQEALARHEFLEQQEILQEIKQLKKQWDEWMRDTTGRAREI
jgi:protein-arginine kinase activator protein McsA